MKLIVGLGNTGDKYQKNRHNLGFVVVDKLVVEFGYDWEESQDWMCFFAKSDGVILIKPTTFMNKSGAAVSAVSSFYKVKPKDILIIYDEVDLPFGKIRLSHEGLSAGHKGVDSVISGLGGYEFSRLRIGIGRPEVGDAGHAREVSDYVLEDFTTDEMKQLNDVVNKCVDAIKSYISDGLQATMNRFN